MLDPAAATAAPSPSIAPSTPVPPALSWRYVAWRLVFTKRNEVDLGYAFLIPFLGLFYAAWVLAARGRWTVTPAMWTALVSVIGSMLVATVPVWRARIMRDRDYGMSGDLGYGSELADVEVPFSTAPTADAR
jgi:hypothetical protein